MAARKPIRERFNEKWQFIAPTGCWEWTGNRLPKGYGRLYDNGKKDKRMAHRISYELHIGPAPDGMDVCHKCDNPRCVNPEHLFLGTRSDNMQDMVRKGRFRACEDLRGERHGMSKLKEREARAIQEMYRRHPTKCGNGGNGLLQFLADWLGVSRSLISKVGKKQYWKHI